MKTVERWASLLVVQMVGWLVHRMAAQLGQMMELKWVEELGDWKVVLRADLKDHYSVETMVDKSGSQKVVHWDLLTAGLLADRLETQKAGQMESLTAAE